jgi:hypothetical protein
MDATAALALAEFQVETLLLTPAVATIAMLGLLSV